MGKKKKQATQALATTPQPPAMTAADLAAGPEALISQAIAAGASIDTLERVMALRKDVLAEKAKQAFNEAMAAFQEECPVIKKTKGVKTKAGAEAYKYAPIDSIITQVKACVKKHGFSYRTSMQLLTGNVKVVCRVVHMLGHEETSEMEVPLSDGTQIMSKTQVVAAASTFAKRYAFLNAFGIMTGDDDDDTASERADAPGREKPADYNDYKKKPLQEDVVAPAPGPKYEKKKDDGGSMTPKQRAFIAKRWGEYMDKRGVEGDTNRAEALAKTVTWIFEKKGQKGVTLETLTISQASYVIDYIPTMPLPGKETVIDAKVVPTPTPRNLTPAEIDELKESLRQAPDLPALNVTWAEILEIKKRGLLGGSYIPLHQLYISTKVELEKALTPSAK